MHSEYDRVRQAPERSDQSSQPPLGVDVLGSVQGSGVVRARRELEFIGGARSGPGLQQQIDHHVAHAMNALPDPLFPEVGDRCGRRAQEQTRHVIRQSPIDLLRHAHVEATKTRLDVGHGDIQLGRGEGPCERGVRVTHHDHDGGLPAQHLVFERRQHSAHGRAVGPGTEAQVRIGLGYAQLIEELLRHPCVVVLTGVNETDLQPRAQRLAHRRQLDDLGSRADDDHRARAPTRAGLHRVWGLSSIADSIAP